MRHLTSSTLAHSCFRGLPTFRFDNSSSIAPIGTLDMKGFPAQDIVAYTISLRGRNALRARNFPFRAQVFSRVKLHPFFPNTNRHLSARIRTFFELEYRSVRRQMEFPLGILPWSFGLLSKRSPCKDLLRNSRYFLLVSGWRVL